VVEGTIASLRARQGFGFIASEGRRVPIFFRREAVEGDRFDQLREGQRVAFAESPDPLDPRRTRADRVLPREE
jgi:cold shock CspA family protein